MKIDKNFFWGGATASNQYEGGIFEDGAGLSTADVMTNGTHTVKRQVTWINQDGEIGSTPLCFRGVKDAPDGIEVKRIDDGNFYYPSTTASDFYHHYKEDIKLCADEGFNALRFSIKWSRIYPTGLEDKPNEEGLKFYEDVFKECRKYNIEPIVTLEHYENPLYLANKYNGWESRELVDLFLKYVNTCFERFNGLVKYYLTFNEINCIEEAPFVTAGVIHGTKQAIASASFHQFLASSKVVKLAHEKYPDLKIGSMLAYGPVYPLTEDPKDQLLASKIIDQKLYYMDVQMLGKYPNYKLIEYEKEGIKLPIKENDLELIEKYPCDFLSFSCYGSNVVTTHDINLDKGDGNGVNTINTVTNSYLKTNAWGWTIDPDCLRITMNTLYNRYHKDLFCVENGIGWNDVFEDNTVHDSYRIDYMRSCISSMKDAIEIDGIPMMGYLYWGCVDMVSNGEGERAKRYGQIYVDVDNKGEGTYKRYLKDSYYWYQKCIKSNGEDLD